MIFERGDYAVLLGQRGDPLAFGYESLLRDGGV